MKKMILPFMVAVLFITSLVLTGCSGSSGSGEVITEKKDIANFNAIEIGSAFDLDVTYSDTYSVTISADESMFEYIEVSQTGTKLTIYLNPHHIFTDFTLGEKVLKAEISMPLLQGLEVSGACNAKVTGFHSTSDLFLSVSGATKLNLDGIDAGSIFGEVSGASRISGNLTGMNVVFVVGGASSLEMSGSAVSVDLEVNGASRADLEGFRAGDVDVKVSGASEATVYAGNTLDVNVSGASRLYFIGNPTLGESSVSGASTIKHKE